MKAVNEYNLSGKDNSKFTAIAKKNDLNIYFLKRGVDYFSTSYGKGIIERDAVKPWFSLVQDKYDPKKAAKYSRQFLEEYQEALKKIDTVDDIKKKSYSDFKNNIRDIFTFTEKELLSLINKSQLSRYQELKATQDFLENGMRSQHRNQFAKQIIPHVRDFLYKAHRKPPDQKDVLEMSKDFINATAKFGMDVAARMFVIRTFAHMRFVFRHEEKSGRPTRVSDYELANRLSYFLWATAPDDELLKLDPRDKQNVGKRLSRWALAKEYGMKIPYQSPRYKSMKVEGNKVILEIDHVFTNLYTFDVNEPQGFTIAGADKKFVNAKAKLVGKNKIEVWSDAVKEPASVRYAWANNPICNRSQLKNF